MWHSTLRSSLQQQYCEPKMPPRKRKKSSTFTKSAKDGSPPAIEAKRQVASQPMPQGKTRGQGRKKAIPVSRDVGGKIRERMEKTEEGETSESKSIETEKQEPTSKQLTKSYQYGVTR